MWTDNETDRDFLNFEGVADTIAEMIVRANGRPVSIGVSGDWGVGKSSMIKLTKSSLGKHQPEDSPKKYLFVDLTLGYTKVTTMPALRFLTSLQANSVMKPTKGKLV